MSAYFQLNPFADFVITELTNREQNIGLNSPTVNNPYQGPLSAWTRIASMGSLSGKDGFVLGGVFGFDDTFGFNSGDQGSSILGYTFKGTPHQVPPGQETLKHRPTPGVTAVDVTLNNGIFREVTFRWQCWSKSQLDYMEAYFMTPGLTIVVEWGWNNYDPSSLFSLTDLGSPSSLPPPLTSTGVAELMQGYGIKGAFAGIDTIMSSRVQRSHGNYDAAIGMITGWTSEFNAQGGYDCSTTIVTKCANYSGLAHNVQNIVQNGVPKINLHDWLIQKLPIALHDYQHKIDPPSLFKDHKGPEDRIFCGRYDGSLTRTTMPAQYDFDNTPNNDYWLNFNFIIDMVNIFYKDSSKSGIETRFDISRSWISAHPNIKSTNGAVLLLPNAKSPTWTDNQQVKVPGNTSFEDRFETDNSGDASLATENQAIMTSIGTATRDDISVIIAEALKGDPRASFPVYGKQSDVPDPQGYAGLLGALYIHARVVCDAFASTDNIKDALMTILHQASAAACDIWNFDIRGIDNEGKSNSYLTIVDTNFIGFTSADQLLDVSTYIFKPTTAESIVINSSFKTELSQAVAMQTFYDYKENTTGPQSTPFVPVTLTDLVTGGPFSVDTDVPPKPSDPANTYSITVRNGTDTPNFYYYTLNGVKYALTELPSVVKDEIIISTVIQHTGCMPGAQFTLTMLGIGGIKFQDFFQVQGLQDRYSKGCVFQVIDLKHSIENNKWLTTITAGVRPATEFLGNYRASTS